MVTTAAEARPLTEDEKSQLRDLMARDTAFATPATRFGEPYEALINLSVRRRGENKDNNADLVLAGETVYLTVEEAAAFNRKGARDGRQVDVVRKLSGPDGSREPLPRIPPRAVSGRLFRPVMPPPESDAARPDPDGSSRIQYLADQGRAPESEGAMTASPEEMADHLSEAPASAMDIPPRGARPRRGQ